MDSKYAQHPGTRADLPATGDATGPAFDLSKVLWDPPPQPGHLFRSDAAPVRDAAPELSGRWAAAGWAWLPTPRGPEPAPEPEPVDTSFPAYEPTPPVAPHSVPAPSTPAVAGGRNSAAGRIRRWRRPLIAAGFFVVLLLVAGIGALALWPSDSQPAASDVPAADPTAVVATTATQSAESPAPAPMCAANTTGAVVTGAGPGDTTSGPDVIQKFDYAYYVQRSGAAARAAAAPSSRNLGTADTLQDSIDKVATGTQHCLRIQPTAANTWDVTLTLLAPGNSVPTIVHQVITTTVENGQTLISAIPQSKVVSTATPDRTG
ncbi:hypothetical protein [Williamsia sterculiae]|uniref:DUF8176 domain-containing protein n=1 Tax=Williamsia sterculiae TaxID=1344003 RepID=A0A1N7HEX9_9NOCA|nr:hypothetical protein [Williamsia sterculiae]SIS23301.1 hypothetical protein SAMN05445060_4093 [Williamsia sterculiae]